MVRLYGVWGSCVYSAEREVISVFKFLTGFLGAWVLSKLSGINLYDAIALIAWADICMTRGRGDKRGT